MKNLHSVLLVIFLLGLPDAVLAAQAQPVPIPEDPSVAPQVNISGTGIGSLAFGKTAESGVAKARVNLSDSALEVGAAQKLYHESDVGSFGFGALTIDDTNRGSSLFFHKAFVDFQTEKFEVLFGRSDNPTAHLVDFPTLRGDDLLTLTNPLNPYSKGDVAEEHRYANVASFTLNQRLTYFENFHVQHLLDSSGVSSDTAINSFGVTLGYLGEPGMESLEASPAWGIGFEQMTRLPGADGGIHEAYAGGVVNVRRSPTHRWELGLQSITNWGSDLRALSNATDSFRADASIFAASLRYLNSPFGAPSYQVALTAGAKKYFKVSNASSWGLALTAVKRLGPGFDLVAQYQTQWRDSALAAAQAKGTSFEHVGELGFTYNFDATFNRHISPQRSLLNQRHGYIRD